MIFEGFVNWVNTLFVKKPDVPKANLSFDGGKLVVKSHNKAWIDKLRWDLGDLTFGKSDDEVVKLYVDRENLEHEEPRLTVDHMGIDENGKIKMKLDWNQAFIKLLRDKAGIVAESEEEAVQAYMLRLTMDVAENMGLPTELSLSTDQIQEQMRQVATELSGDYEREMIEAEELANKITKKPRRRKVNRNTDA
jgi:hypothetical protein